MKLNILTYREKTSEELKLLKFKGIENTCPKCNKRGHFGSVLKQLEADGTWWIICGWCNTITRDLENENTDV